MSLQSQPKPPKSDTLFWDQFRGKIHTKKGGWVIGEAVYNHGYSMMDDLVGSASYFQIIVLNVTGRLPEKKFTEWLEAVFICMSWPDHRIWCNQIGSLAGTMGCSAVGAVSAGILASDSRIYGIGPLVEGVAFIVNAMKWREEGLSVPEIVNKYRKNRSGTPNIIGYKRPVAKGDERVVALKRVAQKLDFPIGAHLQLAFEVEEHLLRNHSECMNIVGYYSAFMTDQGFTAEEIFRMSSIALNAGVLACYSETADSPPLSFYPLQCEDIDYQGTPPRSLPSAKEP